jgi:hypothetical protein
LTQSLGVVIGGTSLSGGVGSVFGTLIGVMIMSILRIGLPSMDLQPHYQKLFTGIVVIIAVMMDHQPAEKTLISGCPALTDGCLPVRHKVNRGEDLPSGSFKLYPKSFDHMDIKGGKNEPSNA